MADWGHIRDDPTWWDDAYQLFLANRPVIAIRNHAALHYANFTWDSNNFTCQTSVPPTGMINGVSKRAILVVISRCRKMEHLEWNNLLPLEDGAARPELAVEIKNELNEIMDGIYSNDGTPKPVQKKADWVADWGHIPDNDAWWNHAYQLFLANKPVLTIQRHAASYYASDEWNTNGFTCETSVPPTDTIEGVSKRAILVVISRCQQMNYMDWNDLLPLRVGAAAPELAAEIKKDLNEIMECIYYPNDGKPRPRTLPRP